MPAVVQLFLAVFLGLVHGVGLAEVIIELGFFGQQAVVLVQNVDFLLGQVLGVDEAVAGALVAATSSLSLRCSTRESLFWAR